MARITLALKDTHCLLTHAWLKFTLYPGFRLYTYTLPYSISVMVIVLTCQTSSLLGMNRSSLARWPTQREAISPKKMLSNSNVSVVPLQETKV